MQWDEGTAAVVPAHEEGAVDKLALGVAVVGVALGLFLMFGTKTEAGPKPASAESLAVVASDVAALKALPESLAAAQASLATETEARVSAEARVQALEVALRDLGERQADLEKRLAEQRPANGESVTTTELHVKSADGRTLLRIGEAAGGGGSVELFSKSGKRAARLFARTDDDGELTLHDHKGELRANIGGNDDGGYANFYGGDGRMAAYLGADASKKSGLIAVYGEGKKEVVGLYANSKGGVVSVRNAETDKQIVMIGAEPNNGMAFIGLGTDQGKAALAGFVTKNGGQIKTLNADGATVGFLGVSANPAGNGLLYVSRKDGKRLMETGAGTEGGGYMSFKNSKDERVLFLGASSGEAPDDGVLEVARKNGKLGVVLRAYESASSVRVYDKNEKVIKQLR